AVAVSGAVYVDAGSYGEDIDIAKNLTIEAAGAGAVALESPSAATAMTIEAGCSVSIVGLTIRNSLIGVRVEGGTATISGATIRDNTFGVYVNGGGATISGSLVFANTTGIRFSGGATGSITGNSFDGAASPDNGVDLLLSASAGTLSIGAGNAFDG